VRRAGRVIIVLAALAASSSALAQPRRAGGPSAPAERRDVSDPARATERREQIKKKIRAMRAYVLTEELSLDDQSAAKLFPVLARYDDETDKLLERRVEIQRRLRRAQPFKDAKAVDRVVDEALVNQRAFWELEDRRIAELRKILTPGQAARLLVVLPELERKIRNQLRKAIVSQRAPGAPAAGGADDDDPQPDELAPPQKPVQRRREAPRSPPPPPPAPRATSAPGNTPPCSPGSESCR
jgi:Spy/CpxP family protein refolding chaperone